MRDPQRLKAPQGQYRVISVDTFDDTEVIEGDFSYGEAVLRAYAKGGVMMKVYVYDDKGKCQLDTGTY